MATQMKWGEEITVLMELGFEVNYFTLDDDTLGILDGEGYLDGTLLGDDVSAYCQSISISRGRPDQLQNFNAGTCSITLNNNDRRFDPINESSPYWDSTKGRSGVTPRRKVTVFSNGVPIFTGRITDVNVDYQPTQPTATLDNSTVQIIAADDFVIFANTTIQNDVVPTQELSGTRVNTILDLPEVGYSETTRNVSAGTAILGGGATFTVSANTNVLTYLQAIGTAEQGYLFVSADGNLTFTDRVTASFATISATFSDEGTNIPYQKLAVLYGQELLYNKIQATIINGTDQIANDLTSQTEFGVSTLSLSELLLSADSAALTLAEELLARYSEPQYRFDKIQSIYNGLSTAKQDDLTGLELGDVVSITRTYPTGSPATVTKLYSIEAIRHSVNNNEHQVEYSLAVADLVFEFILDDDVYGILDSTNALS